MYLADLHVHSSFSDGKLSIPQLVDFYGKLGFGAIAITDHLCEEQTVIGKAAKYLGRTLTPETFSKYIETIYAEAERAWWQYKMILMPGMELTKNSILNHRSAHILGIGIDQYINADQSILKIANAIREQGGLSVAAHPVHTRKAEKQTYHLWDHRDELSNAFDAWEVASGPYIFDEVAQTGLPKLATSDLHHPAQIHSWKTRFDCERHPEAILDAIRKQKVSFEFFSLT